MSNVFAISGMILFPALSLFFWVRGLVHACMSDLAAGLAILVVTWFVLSWLTWSSAVFSQMGCILIIFGAVTYGTSFVVKDNQLYKRQDVVLAAVVLIVLGFVGLIML